MSTEARIEEAADQVHASVGDHDDEGYGWTEQPSVRCDRQLPPSVANQPRRGRCPGRIDGGVCDFCQRPDRSAP